MAIAQDEDGSARARHRRRKGPDSPMTTPVELDALPTAETKLLLPRLRPEMVVRPRVQEVLERDDVMLTLVTAPPGYGKTVAARTWYERFGSRRLGDARGRRQRPGAVLDLRGDGRRTSARRPWPRCVRRLKSPGHSVESAVIDLMNGIATFGAPLTLVLDDFQSITDVECLRLDRLRARPHAPENTADGDDAVRPVAQPRAVARKRGARRGSGHNLALTAEEARDLLVERGGLALGPDEVEVLRERTEGWPGALYLALLWLRGVENQHEAVREFGGDHRFVADYLNHEVLSSLDEASRWFLLRTSVLRQFTAALCDSVFGSSDAASMLKALEHSNTRRSPGAHGMVPCPPAVRRVCRVPARVARRRRLAGDPPAGCPVVSGRTSGLVPEAVEHAVAAHDRKLVAGIASDHHLQLIRSGGARTLVRWAKMLPDEQLVEHPELAMAAATAVSLVGPRTVERRRFLQLAERARTTGSHDSRRTSMPASAWFVRSPSTKE